MITIYSPADSYKYTAPITSISFRVEPIETGKWKVQSTVRKNSGTAELTSFITYIVTSVLDTYNNRVGYSRTINGADVKIILPPRDAEISARCPWTEEALKKSANDKSPKRYEICKEGHVWFPALQGVKCPQCELLTKLNSIERRLIELEK